MLPHAQGVRFTDSFYLRNSSADDRDFLIELYVSGREFELPYLGESLIRMQYDARRMQYLHRFPGTAPKIIVTSGRSVGSIWLAPRDAELCIVDLAISADFRNRGLGSAVIEQVAEPAWQEPKPLTLTVSRMNSRAVRLYERLGFCVTSKTAMDLCMRRELNH